MGNEFTDSIVLMRTNKSVYSQNYFIFAVFLIVCFYFSFFKSLLPLSHLWLHFLIVVNDKFRIVEVNSRFLVFC